MAFLWLVPIFVFIGTIYGCGVPAIPPVITGYARIVNGEEAVPHSWPWQVSLQDFTGFYLCGGSLINENWVATAAHCRIRNGHRVILGQHDKSKSDEDIQTIRVGKVFTHPMWNAHTFSNDLTLVKLTTAVTLNPHVSPVCLASSSHMYQPGMCCVISGWGQTHRNAMQAFPSQLQQGVVTLLTKEQCMIYWGDKVSDVMICAGGGGAAPCMGDYGGPLVCERDGIWSLVGIMSWGSSLCSTTTPSVYTHVAALRSWVDQILAVS
ncbi:chymotrypsin B-like [Megalops cyprinoides]|uniref:chymotrypsin B-like n=1 Tax=Megalops cyprinoides TaxID=118141 RepID=UPI001864473D|nr:chymotrypsin B-like [Megalops cyprinoides]